MSEQSEIADLDNAKIDELEEELREVKDQKRDEIVPPEPAKEDGGFSEERELIKKIDGENSRKLLELMDKVEFLEKEAKKQPVVQYNPQEANAIQLLEVTFRTIASLQQPLPQNVLNRVGTHLDACHDAVARIAMERYIREGSQVKKS